MRTDLAIENLSSSKAHPNDGEKVTIRFRARNLGETNIKAAPYELRLKGGGRISGYYDYLWISGVLNDIPVGGWKDFSREFVVPWNVDATRINKIVVSADQRSALRDAD